MDEKARGRRAQETGSADPGSHLVLRVGGPLISQHLGESGKLVAVHAPIEGLGVDGGDGRRPAPHRRTVERDGDRDANGEKPRPSRRPSDRNVEEGWIAGQRGRNGPRARDADRDRLWSTGVPLPPSFPCPGPSVSSGCATAAGRIEELLSALDACGAGAGPDSSVPDVVGGREGRAGGSTVVVSESPPT